MLGAVEVEDEGGSPCDPQRLSGSHAVNAHEFRLARGPIGSVGRAPDAEAGEIVVSSEKEMISSGGEEAKARGLEIVHAWREASQGHLEALIAHAWRSYEQVPAAVGIDTNHFESRQGLSHWSGSGFPKYENKRVSPGFACENFGVIRKPMRAANEGGLPCVAFDPGATAQYGIAEGGHGLAREQERACETCAGGKLRQLGQEGLFVGEKRSSFVKEFGNDLQGTAIIGAPQILDLVPAGNLQVESGMVMRLVDGKLHGGQFARFVILGAAERFLVGGFPLPILETLHRVDVAAGDSQKKRTAQRGSCPCRVVPAAGDAARSDIAEGTEAGFGSGGRCRAHV